MRTQHFNLKALAIVTILGMAYSCNQDKIDPALVLDEILVPEGYVQESSPDVEAMGRLEELRLENPTDHFYYLKRVDPVVTTGNEWIFPQKELLIKYVDYQKTANNEENPALLGLIVKKIKGDWQNEEFTIFEEMPQPEGGIQALYSYIAQNLKYPEEARKMGIEGKVFVEFVVDKKGQIVDVKVIKGIGNGCDEEAARVLQSSPSWIPARVMDMSVNVKMILPINYMLDNSK